MLPSLIPNARIMAFGYNSIWFGDDAVQLPLASAADNLLSALRSKRRVLKNTLLPTSAILTIFRNAQIDHSFSSVTVLVV
jgi:hypothetical protein